jgi:hypothetical protein
METSKSNTLLTLCIGILLIAAIGYIAWQNKVTRTLPAHTSPLVTTPIIEPDPLPTKDIQITTPLNSPLSGDVVISGAARLVYFEGSFPVYLLNGEQQVWAKFATAQGDWMTTDYVPFQIDLPTQQIPNGDYTLKLVQDDPSGEVPLDALYTLSVPITIQN